MALTSLIAADADRYAFGGSRVKALLYPGFWASAGYRLAHAVHGDKPGAPRYLLAHLLTMCVSILLHVEIEAGAVIGPGLYIPHAHEIVIARGASIGSGATVLHGVTVGLGGRGTNRGVPSLGDHVYLGAGAKAIGKIRLGDGVAVGANAVVLRDAEDGAVCVGVPARVISHDGSEGLP